MVSLKNNWLTCARYSFCRVADDLVDDAKTQEEAHAWCKKLSKFLDLAYSTKEVPAIKDTNVDLFITNNFPKDMQSGLQLLPTHLLSSEPLYELLEGFKTDLDFSDTPKKFPITDEKQLQLYGRRVAGTVAESCLELVFHHSYSPCTAAKRNELIKAGGRMGIALQYVNIARDIARDAVISRVYLPTTWLKEKDLTPEDVVKRATGPQIEVLRTELLDKAFEIYQEAHFALARLPRDARAPMRVAIESYMEIGRVLREKGYTVKEGKATVPKLRRIRVAWNALRQG